jgi:release factor glutamine methyltransferase
MIRKLIKIFDPILKWFFQRYYSKPRKYRYQNIEVIVYPEVFPPHFTISTKLLLDFINSIDLKGKNVLELGCGSGIISLLAASKGALVTASDINKTALEALEKASVKNALPVQIINSNLFDKLHEKHFDYIIINPPYYPKAPKNDKQHAWFCGENFEYFEKLFEQLPSYIEHSEVLMILSEDCDLEKISTIAQQYDLKFKKVLEKKVMTEINYIYKVHN